jgi:hypothetical protein
VKEEKISKHEHKHVRSQNQKSPVHSHRESSKTNEERSGVLQTIDKTNKPNITHGVMGDLTDGSSTCITIGGMLDVGGEDTS